MAVNTITYANKAALNENPNIDAVNKCQASDMNEIKSVVNNNANELSQTITTITPTILYENQAGETGDITLSNNSNNYSYVDIVFSREGSGTTTNRLYKGYWTGATIMTSLWLNSIFRVYTTPITISGTSLTRLSEDYYANMPTSGGANSGSSSPTIFIHKVIGYK